MIGNKRSRETDFVESVSELSNTEWRFFFFISYGIVNEVDHVGTSIREAIHRDSAVVESRIHFENLYYIDRTILNLAGTLSKINLSAVFLSSSRSGTL